MKKYLLLLALLCAVGAKAQTVQCLTANGAWGPCPLNASVQLFNATAATATATATATKVYNFSMTGTLIVNYASITGTPSGCSLQVQSGDSLGNVVNNGVPIFTNPANGTTSIAFIPTPGKQTADEISVVYACGVYPTAGTISLEYVPATSPVSTDTSNRLFVDDPQAITTLTQILNKLATLSANTGIVRNALGQPLGTQAAPMSVTWQQPDPCAYKKASTAISQTAAATIVTTPPGMRVYVCSELVVAGAAEIPSWIEGTGSACGTGTLAVSGSTTTANGISLAANGGFTRGNGQGTIFSTQLPGDNLCLTQNGSNRLAGSISYVIAP